MREFIIHYYLLLMRFLLLLVTLFLSGCYYSHSGEVDNHLEPGKGGIDSVDFYIAHHYWTDFNFEATDSLQLIASSPITGLKSLSDYRTLVVSDTVRIKRGDPLVVARIMTVPGDTIDSIWVKVARDQMSQGWIRERTLLEKTVPNDPISKFIDAFSGGRTIVVFCILGVAVFFWLLQSMRHKRFRMVHARDIPSFYPTLLCLCVSGSAALYGSIQRFIPETWVEFYYHPTLNPFNAELPLIMALFIASVWILLIVAVAVVDEMRRQPDFGDTLQYLASLGGVCMVLYLVFTLTTPIYIGYPLLILYWAFAIRQYLRHKPSHLLCGICGRSIPGKGRCPHCGAINE